MDTLREVENARQRAGEPRRRWFTSERLDLIVWSDDAGRPIGFQLCYGKPTAERALTWTPETGFTHTGVDDGQDVGLGHKRSPILVPDGDFDLEHLEQTLGDASLRLPADVTAFVADALKRHPQRRDRV
jgi:hypothetical protein